MRHVGAKALNSSGRNIPLKWSVSCILEAVGLMLGPNLSCDESFLLLRTYYVLSPDIGCTLSQSQFLRQLLVIVVFWRENLESHLFHTLHWKAFWIFAFSSLCLAYLVFPSNDISSCLSKPRAFCLFRSASFIRGELRKRSIKLILIFW